MKKYYGVWIGEWVDNDTPDWHDSHDAAFDAWHELAATLDEGESAYMQRFHENGDVDEDFPHELRREDGMILEYYAGERMWA